MADIKIQSCTFRPDDLVEVTYTEEREQADDVGIIRVVIVEREVVASEAAEVVEDLQLLVDAALRHLRENRN